MNGDDLQTPSLMSSTILVVEMQCRDVGFAVNVQLLELVRLVRDIVFVKVFIRIQRSPQASPKVRTGVAIVRQVALLNVRQSFFTADLVSNASELNRQCTVSINDLTSITSVRPVKVLTTLMTRFFRDSKPACVSRSRCPRVRVHTDTEGPVSPPRSFNNCAVISFRARWWNVNVASKRCERNTDAGVGVYVCFGLMNVSLWQISWIQSELSLLA